MASMEWEVVIRGAKRGFIVNVSCMQLVFSDGEKDQFLRDLSLLMSGDRKAPEELRRKYFPEDYEGKLQATGMVPPPTYVGQDCEARPETANGRY